MNLDSHYRLSATSMRDEELVYLANTGNKYAEELLVKRYETFVEKKARPYYIVGAEKADVLQEGMIGLLYAIRGYQEEKSKFSSFAEICVIRQILTAIKRERRRKNLVLLYATSIQQTYEENGECNLLETLKDETNRNPEDILLKSFDASLQLDSAYECFSYAEQSVLALFAEGLSYEEMTEKLQCNIKYVDNALQRARRKLQKTRLHN